ITYSDADPTMYAILANALGAEFARGFYASCSFEADAVLRRAFIDRIRRQPWDYFDLVAFRLRSVLAGATGTYAGEFDEGENLSSFGVPPRLRRLARRFSERSGHVLRLGATVFAPFALWAAIRRREAALAFALVTIG